jgi:hypothetical protein
LIARAAARYRGARLHAALDRTAAGSLDLVEANAFERAVGLGLFIAHLERSV